MPISVQCESCFQTYRVADDKAGKAIKCKDCGGRIQVPSQREANDGDDDSGAQSAGRAQRRPVPKKKRGGGPNKTVLIASCAGAGVVVMGLVVFLLSRGGAGPQAGGSGALATPDPGAIAGWKAAADPPANPVNWPATVNVSITIPGKSGLGLGDEVSYPSSESPFVAVGFGSYESNEAQMWNLVTGTQTGAIKGQPSKSSKRHVSPDGKYLALELLDARNTFELWSFETGELVKKIVVDDSKFSTHLFDFAGADQFVTYSFGPTFSGSYAHRLKIWDIPRGKLIRQIDVGHSDVNQYHFAFSPGRRFFASFDFQAKISIIDLQTGGPISTVAMPTKSPRDPVISGKALTFSSDGRQLVALLGGAKEMRIATIDMQTGKHDPDQDAVFLGDSLAPSINTASYKGPKICCLPNQAGYLVDGEVWIDGKTKRVVWRLTRQPDTFNHTPRLPVPNGFVADQDATNSRRLTVVEIPWKQIQATLAAIDAKQPARLRPGSPVKLDLQVGNIQHGDAEKTKADLTALFKDRLTSQGFELQDAAPIALKVTYEEAAGETLGETKRNLGNPLPQTTTGKTVQSTRAEVGFTWLREEGNAVIWSSELKFNPEFLILKGDATEQGARDSMFDGVRNAILSFPIPFFVPEDDSLLQLPGSTELKK